eukprot:gene10896-12714_t
MVCVKSVLAQSKPLDLFCVSWSADEFLVEDTNKICLNFKGKFSYAGVAAKFLRQSDRCQQFQHYLRISRFMAGSSFHDDTALVIFGDHDDRWAEKRVEIMSSYALTSTNEVCVFPSYVHAAAKEEKDYINKTRFEYWTATVRFRVFANFFEEIDHRYLASAYCDCAFVKYLRSRTPEYHVEVRGPKCDLYYYSGAHGGACESAKHVIVKEMEESLMRCYPSSNLPVNDSYENELVGFTLLKSVNIDDLLVLKNDIRKLDEYVLVTK